MIPFICGTRMEYRVMHPVEIAKIVNCKQNYHSEQRIFPNVLLSDLRADLIEKAQRLIRANNPGNHLAELDPQDFLTRIGFFRKNEENQVGYTLAAVLSGRHNPLSLRSKIFRELVANIIAHREYMSPQPAFINIFKERVEFTNPNNPAIFGKIDPQHFTPVAKNPTISKLMIQMSRAEDIGSGIRNVTKYLPYYAKDATVDFMDGETGEYLADNAGICNRVTSCGYHYTPKEYFRDNKIFTTPEQPKPMPTSKAQKSSIKTSNFPKYIKSEIFRKSLAHYEKTTSSNTSKPFLTNKPFTTWPTFTK